MSDHSPTARRRSRVPVILLIVVLVVTAALAGTYLVRRSAGPATAQSTDAPSDSTNTDAVSDSALAQRGSSDDDDNDDEDADKPIPVEVVNVLRQDVPAFFTGTATLEAENSAQILAQTAGQVLHLHVEEGDWVEKGDLLLEIDGRQETIILEERRADLLTLKHEVERQQALFDRSLSSESELIAAKANYEAAEARRRAAELGLTFTEVHAPFHGVVTGRMVGVGDHLTLGQEIFHLANTDPLLARIYMPEREVNRIRVGQEVRISSDANPDHSFAGLVSRIAPMVDRRTGTVKVTVELGSGDRVGLLPGSFVRVFVETDRHPNALIIPERAIMEQGGETFVYRIEEGDGVQRIRVETGYVYDDQIEILTGLSENDRIVTAGQASLRSDSTVRIIGDEKPDEQNEDDEAQGDSEALAKNADA